MAIFNSYVSLPEGTSISHGPRYDPLQVLGDLKEWGKHVCPICVHHVRCSNPFKLWKDPPFLMGKSTINGHFE